MTKKKYNSLSEIIINHFKTNKEIDLEQIKKEIDEFLTIMINSYNLYDDTDDDEFRCNINTLLSIIDFEKEIIENNIDHPKKNKIIKLIDDILKEKLKKFNISIL